MQKTKILTVCFLGILAFSFGSPATAQSDLAYVVDIGESKSYVVSKLQYNGTNTEPMEVQLQNGSYVNITVTEGDSYTVTVDSINTSSTYAECNYTYGEYSTIPWYCHEVEPVTTNTSYWNERINQDALWDTKSKLDGNIYKQSSTSNYTEGNDRIFTEYKYEFDTKTGWVVLNYYKTFYENGSVIYEHETKPGSGSGSAPGFEVGISIFAFLIVITINRKQK